MGKPRNDWSAGFGIGLFVGVALIVFLTFFISSGHQEGTQMTPSIDQAANSAYQCGNGNEPVWGPWYGLCFGLFDSVAQWIMMAFTIVAACLLYGTLMQTNKTNKSAVKASNAAIEANKIMRADQRPWLILHREVECDFADRGNSGAIAWNCDFENRGRSPAFDVTLHYTLIKRSSLINMQSQLQAFLEDVAGKNKHNTLAVLLPGEKTDFLKFRRRGILRYQLDEFSVGEGVAGRAMMMACLTYRLSTDSDEIGYDVRMFGIEESKRWLGPWGHRLIEYATERLVG